MSAFALFTLTRSLSLSKRITLHSRTVSKESINQMAQESDSGHEWQHTVTCHPSSSAEPNSAPVPPFLRLPPELRLRIYNYATDFKLEIAQQPQRPLHRKPWICPPPTTQHLRLPNTKLNLVSVCRLIRQEVLPDLFRTQSVRFPAWNTDLKLRCLYWIDAVSDEFIRGIDRFSLKGVYWTYDITLKHESRQNEGEDAGGRFELRVQGMANMGRRGEVAAAELRMLLEQMFRDRHGRDGLSKEEVKDVIRGARLCAVEQLGGNLRRGGEGVVDVEESARAVEMMRTLGRCGGCSMHLASGCRRESIWKYSYAGVAY